MVPEDTLQTMVLQNMALQTMVLQIVALQTKGTADHGAAEHGAADHGAADCGTADQGNCRPWCCRPRCCTPDQNAVAFCLLLLGFLSCCPVPEGGFSMSQAQELHLRPWVLITHTDSVGAILPALLARRFKRHTVCVKGMAARESPVSRPCEGFTMSAVGQSCLQSSAPSGEQQLQPDQGIHPSLEGSCTSAHACPLVSPWGFAGQALLRGS